MTVYRVMNGASARLVFTDVAYNVRIVGNVTRGALNGVSIVRLALELSEADDEGFAVGCCAMMTGDGPSLLEELCETLQRPGSALDLVSDAVKLTRTRLLVSVGGLRQN